MYKEPIKIVRWDQGLVIRSTESWNDYSYIKNTVETVYSSTILPFRSPEWSLSIVFDVKLL